MKKTNLLVIVYLWVIFSGSSGLYASCSDNCDPNLPTWYLTGTQCEITPYYYKVEIDASQSWYSDNVNPPASGTETGSCTEYWDCVNCQYPNLLSCIESVYSYDDDANDIYCGLFTNGACYGFWYWWWPYPCESDEHDYSVSGSWNDKVFSGSGYSNYDEEDGPNYSHYSASTTITAEFDRDDVPEDCLTAPKVTIKDYEATMFVKPKNMGCCKTSAEQEIRISCLGASHIIVTPPEFDGDMELIDFNSVTDYEKGCNNTGNHASSGWIKIRPNHNNFTVEKDEIKELNVTYKVDFYDHAGTKIDTGTVNVAMVTKCEDEPK